MDTMPFIIEVLFETCFDLRDLDFDLDPDFLERFEAFRASIRFFYSILS